MVLVPKTTFPNEVLLGFTESSTVTPVPASETVAGEFEALLTKETLPVAAPAAVGANVTLKELLCPAASVRGRESPLMLKPVPVNAA